MCEMIFLAILQGIAEFLPISSSGHLALADMFMGGKSKETLAMVLVLHAGTLISVLIVYFSKILAIFKKGHRSFIGYIIIASIPTAIIGLTIKLTGLDDQLFSSTWLVGLGLLLTSFLLWFGLCTRENEDEIITISAEKMGFWRALAIGIMQGIAILPGVSRSGSTIASAVKLGINRSDAAAFSFLVSLPAIIGAVSLKAYGSIKEMGGFSELKISNMAEYINTEYVVGFFVSAIVGILALKLLIKMLEKKTLQYFAIYTFFAGMFVLAIWATNAFQKYRAELSGAETSLEVRPIVFLDSSAVDSKMKLIKKINLDSEVKK